MAQNLLTSYLHGPNTKKVRVICRYVSKIGNFISWMTTFDRRRLSMEQDLQWKTPLMEFDIQWKTTVNGNLEKR